jgi:hypothetical protein
MARLLLVITVMIAMARVGLGYVADAAGDSDRLEVIQSRSERLDRSIQAIEAFTTILRQTLADLSAEEITLAQAVERVEDASCRIHPAYLRALVREARRQSAEVPGVATDAAVRPAALSELIAHNLLWHVECETSDNPADQEFARAALRRLKAELAGMFPPKFCLAPSRD